MESAGTMDPLPACLILFFIGFTTSTDTVVRAHYWAPWQPGSRIPKYAVEAGKGGYVARVYTFNGHITAMIGKQKKIAIAIHDRKIQYAGGIEVLCSRNQDRLYWDPVNWDKYDGEDLDDAVIAGFQKDIRSDLYIGRLKLPHIYKVGKVVPPDRDAPGLWVWREDEPLRVTKFELLKYNDTEIY